MFITLRILGWTAAVVLYVFAAVFALVLGTLLIFPPAWVMIPFIVLFVAGLRTRLKRRRAEIVLDHIEPIMRLNLPLPEMLAGAAKSEPGVVGHRLDALAGQLRQGRGLGEALDRTVRELPVTSRSLLSAAQRVNRLPAALAYLYRRRHQSAHERRERPDHIWGYPIGVIGVLLPVMFTIIPIIMPRYGKIFVDFKVKLPVITQWGISFSNWLYGYGTVYQASPGSATLSSHWVTYMIPGFAWLALAFLIGVILWILARRGVLRPITARLAWWIPVVHRLERDRGLATAFSFAGDCLGAGVPLDQALDEASRVKVNPVLLAKLRRWTRRLKQGQPVDDAAKSAGMPALVCGLLSSAQPAAAMPEVVGFLGRYYEGRYSRTVAVVRGLAGPVTIIFAGALVMFATLAVFLPLVRLIWSQTYGGLHL